MTDDWRDHVMSEPGGSRLGKPHPPGSQIVIATGPRSNGTRLLSRILDTADRYGPGGIHPIHFPVYPPEQIDFAAEFPRALFVVIYRNHQPAARSMVEAGYHASLDAALNEQIRAGDVVDDLAEECGERVYFIDYETLVFTPHAEVAALDAFLRSHGYTGKPLSLPEPIRDENAKYERVAA